MARHHILRTLITGLLGVVGAVTVPSLPAAAAASGDRAARTVRFTTVNRTRHQEDNFTPGASESDTLTSEGPMFQGGRERGHFDLAYTTTRVDATGERKVGTLVVTWNDGSRLAMVTESDFPAGGGPPAQIDPVVVGGSGRFFGARGACRIGFDGTTFDYRCRIVR